MQVFPPPPQGLAGTKPVWQNSTVRDGEHAFIGCIGPYRDMRGVCVRTERCNLNEALIIRLQGGFDLFAFIQCGKTGLI